MDSYIENGKQWVACHECEYGINGKLKNCDTGKTAGENNIFNRGCWGGMLISGLNTGDENEIREQKNSY